MAQDDFPIFFFRSKKDKKFSDIIQDRINKVFSELYWVYPDKVVFYFEKLYDDLKEKIETVKCIGEYTTIEECINDFGFRYIDPSSTEDVSKYKIRLEVKSKEKHEDEITNNKVIRFDYALKYTIEGNKIYLDKEKTKYILDDEIDALSLSKILYRKLVSAKYFKNISDLLLSTNNLLRYYGFTHADMVEIHETLDEYLNNSKTYNIKSELKSKELILESKVEEKESPKLDNQLLEKDDDSNVISDLFLLNLPSNIIDRLLNANIYNIKELKEKVDSLYKVPGFGITTITSISDAIEKYESEKKCSDSFDNVKIGNLSDLDIPSSTIALLNNNGYFTFEDFLNAVSSGIKIPGIGVAKINDITSKINDEKTSNTQQNRDEYILDYCDGKLIYFLNGKCVWDINIAMIVPSTNCQNILFNHGIKKLSKYLESDDYDLLNIPNLGRNKLHEIDISVKSYIENNSFVKNDQTILEHNVLEEIINSQFEGITLMQIADNLKSKATQEVISQIVEKFIEEGLVFVFEENKLFYQYPTFAQSIYKLEKGQIKDILYSRLDGETLEEIAFRYSVTRERIRQIEANAINKLCLDPDGNPIKTFKEDRFKYFFENYDFRKDQFLAIFNVKERTYNYLLMRYKKGKKQLDKAIDDDKILPKFRTLIHKYIFKDYIQINGIYVSKNVSDIEEILAAIYCKNPTKLDDFYEIFSKFVNEHKNELPNITSGKRYIETRISSDTNNVLSYYPKTIRYYNFKEYDFTDLLEALNLSSYQDMEISTKKLYDMHLDMMKQYDIRDEYELHNILKKILSKNKSSNIVFSRMPMINIGNVDRKKYLVSLLRQYGELTLGELTKIVNNELGVDERLIAFDPWVGLIEEYHVGNKYVAKYDYIPFSSEEHSYLSQVLTEPFYSIKQLKNIYLNKFPDGNVDKLECKNLQSIGFNIYSTYILKTEYTSKSFFDKFIKKDIIKKEDYKPYQIMPTFDCIISSYCHNLDLIRFDKQGDYISIERLNEFGITKQDLIDYANDVYDFVPKNEYFTIKSLKDMGFKSKLDDLGFEDDFYASLLTVSDKFIFSLFSSRLFSKNLSTKTVDFIEHILNRFEAIDENDLLDYLNDNYGISLEKYKIIACIKDTEMYYDPIMKKFYKNYQIYFDEI